MLNKDYISHYKATIRLGLPIVVGQLGVIILGFADTMMVGHYDTNSLAAVSFVNNLFTLITIMLRVFPTESPRLSARFFLKSNSSKPEKR